MGDKRKMTKEQIKQEAEEYAKNLAFVYETDIVQRIVRERVRLALIDVLEQRENRIEELEEENNELKGKLLLSDMVLTDKTKRIKELENKLIEKVTLESLDVVSARMEELAKVNADLTARIEKQNADILTLKGLAERQRLWIEALEGQTPWKDIKDKSEVIGQLTKAKELLAKWVEYFKPKGGNIPPTPIQVDTEQFLKEIKK